MGEQVKVYKSIQRSTTMRQRTLLIRIVIFPSSAAFEIIEPRMNANPE
jgi:hypothetical protein